MAKLISLVLAFTVAVAGLAFAATDGWVGYVRPFHSATLGAGGPDAYGYVWIDNDTTAPGAPVYNWVDITAVGDTVTGLGDDNIVGPFSIGFDFPYYWYQVNTFYVGSNGYLRFSSSGQWAQPFPGIPDPAEPNDVLAVLVADLLFGGASPAQAFYYTNGVDSLVVSFIDVPGWSTGGSHTFQVILNRADSTILYQYGPQTGTYSNSETLIGIENATGTVGLEYLEDLLPSGNQPHDTLALLFTPPDTTSYQAHDVGVAWAQNQYNGGFFVHWGAPKTLWCKVKNYGNQPEGSFDVTCLVRDPSNVVVYTDTVTIGSMNPGDIDSVVFSPDWTPAVAGPHRMTATTHLAGDMNSSNNSILVECYSMHYPGQLLYDDGVSENSWAWEWTPGQEAGLGSRFIPPSYPARIDSVSVFIDYAGTVPFIIRICDDDGPAGFPGTVLAADTVTATTAPTWYTVDLSSFNLVIDDGGFYAAWVQTGTDSPRLGLDETLPFSRQALEYTGVWAEFRNKNTSDLMIRVAVNDAYGVKEFGNDQLPMTKSQFLHNYPNPFGAGGTIISFSVERSTSNVSLRVYDLTGRLIRTLVNQPSDHSTIQLSHQVVWDGTDEAGREAPSGLYFARLTAGGSSLTRKLALVR